ncbi:MAG: phosphate acyltransferase PlsX [Anaerolineaceae bacterium]|nr:phosphate acyltransferase PlsX [Anaerolineaceae bacterium]
MAIILDAMGSDQRPEPEISGAIEAALQFNEEIILVGDENVLNPRLKAAGVGSLPVTVVHASETIDMTDKIEDVRSKKDNSMRVGMDLLATGRGGAFVTAGNTGMAMYHAKKSLSDIPGVIRPALSALFPVKGGKCVVLDIGANAECRPEFLVQFAVMGSVYAEKMLDKSNPRVGLLSNGEEAVKGNTLVKESYPLLASCGVNFIGNVEGKELFGGEADVVITDGFTGNVLLKSSEAVAKLITDSLKIELMSSLNTKIGALLAKSAFRNIKKLIDPSEVGAAPLLGIDGLVFVGHGRSDSRAIVSSIRQAKMALDSGLLPSLRTAIQNALGK